MTVQRLDGRQGILLVGNYPPPFGGVPKHLEGLVPHLVRCGWDVHVLSGGTTGIYRGPGFTVYKDSRRVVRRRAGTAGFLVRKAVTGSIAPAIAAARRLPLGLWARIMTRVSLASRIIEERNIRVISAYNLLFGAPVGAIASEMYDLPLVVTNLGEIYSHRTEINRQLSMIRHVTRVASVLTSLTQHCADSYRELNLAPDVRVLHYGIDVRRFAGGDGEVIRRRFGIPSDADVVLYLGRLVRDMGLRVLLDGLPTLLGRRRSVHVLIAGGSGELAGAARDAVSRWPGRVAVAVDIPEAQLASYYAAATIVVAPTLGARACGSLASAEAMAAGKPVIATRIGGIPEYVDHGATGLLVPPGDPGALVEAALELLADRARLVDFGRRGRERVLQLFDSERTDAALERLFRQAAGRR